MITVSIPPPGPQQRRQPLLVERLAEVHEAPAAPGADRDVTGVAHRDPMLPPPPSGHSPRAAPAAAARGSARSARGRPRPRTGTPRRSARPRRASRGPAHGCPDPASLLSTTRSILADLPRAPRRTARGADSTRRSAGTPGWRRGPDALATRPSPAITRLGTTSPSSPSEASPNSSSWADSNAPLETILRTWRRSVRALPFEVRSVSSVSIASSRPSRAAASSRPSSSRQLVGGAARDRDGRQHEERRERGDSEPQGITRLAGVGAAGRARGQLDQRAHAEARGALPDVRPSEAPGRAGDVHVHPGNVVRRTP